jgi:hypothetical protein
MKTILLFTFLLITSQIIFAQYQIDGYKRLVFDKKYGIENKNLSFVFEDTKADVLWFKSENCLYKYNNDTLYSFKKKSDKLIKSINGVKCNKITNVEKYMVSVFFDKQYWIDNKNNIWVFDNNQLNKIVGSTLQRYSLGSDSINNIEAITEDKNGDIWFSTKTMGILKLIGENIIPNYALDMKGVYLTFVDSKDNIWFCSDNEIAILKDINVLRIPNDSVNIMYQVSSFIEIDDSTIWLSSYKGHSSYLYGGKWCRQNIDKNYVHYNNYAPFGIAGMLVGLAIDNMASAVDASPFPSMLLMDKNKNVYLRDFDGTIFNLDKSLPLMLINTKTTTPLTLVRVAGNANNVSTSSIWYNASIRENKLIKLLSVEDIDKIDWGLLYLFHIDYHNNLWFKANDHITLLKKI